MFFVDNICLPRIAKIGFTYGRQGRKFYTQAGSQPQDKNDFSFKNHPSLEGDFDF